MFWNKELVFLLGDAYAGKTTMLTLLCGDEPPADYVGTTSNSTKDCGMRKSHFSFKQKLRILDIGGSLDARPGLEKAIINEITVDPSFMKRKLHMIYCIDGMKLLGDNDDNRRMVQNRCRADIDMLKRIYDDGRVKDECKKKHFYIVVTHKDELKKCELINGADSDNILVQKVQEKLGQMVTVALSDVGGGENRICLLDIKSPDGRKEALECMKKLMLGSVL